MQTPDLLIVGAGPSGCIIAEHAAREKNWTSLIIDKRNHVAGNCYDSVHQSGLLIHNYGPHYFRTNDDDLLKYLAKFTTWIPANYIVKAQYKDQLYGLPINLITLEQFYKRKFTESSAKKFLKTISIKTANPRNSEEIILSTVGRELYEAFFVNYTQKQWGIHPKDLMPSVCGRLPLRFNRDSRYVNHKHQVMPQNGYTHMFNQMIKHPKIQIKLNCNYNNIKNEIIPKIATIYTGAVDEYFNYQLGKLGWRSIKVNFQYYEQEYKQPCVQINYPNDYKYTRTIEIKHITKQKHHGTIIGYEYPIEIGEPFYPIPTQENTKLYLQYEKLVSNEKIFNNIYFIGRLAQYKYINMDEVMLEGINTFKQIIIDAKIKNLHI